VSKGTNPFDSEEVASSYDSWFETPVGRRVAQEELEVFWQKMAPLGDGVPLKSVGGGCGSGVASARFKEAPPLNVLEVGSGTGWLLDKMYHSPFNIRAVVGIEPSEHMRKYASKKFDNVVSDIDEITRLIRLNERFVGIVSGDAMDLPFGEELFDRVVFFTSLEFVPDQDKAIWEALRVLKPGGRIVIVVLNGESPWMKRRIGKGVFASGHFPTVSEFREFLSRYNGNYVSGAVYWMPSEEDRLPSLLPLRAWWNKLWGLKNATALVGYIPKT